MILDTDEHIKETILDTQLLTIEVLKLLGYTTYESSHSVIVHIPYNHPRKYGYFKKRCGSIKGELALFGNKDEHRNITIKTTWYTLNNSHQIILKTLKDLKIFLSVVVATEQMEVENYHLRKIVEPITN